MLPVVAMVEVRPETIGDDYRRVLKLSGLDAFIRDRNPVLVPGASRSHWRPGFGTSPWQLAGVLAARGEEEVRVFPLGTGGRTTPPDSDRWGWQKVLSRAGARELSLDRREAFPVHVSTALPALEAVTVQ